MKYEGRLNLFKTVFLKLGVATPKGVQGVASTSSLRNTDLRHLEIISLFRLLIIH